MVTDGKSVAFAAAKKFGERIYDLWMCSADGGPAIQISTRSIVDDQDLFGQVRAISVAWFEHQLILSAKRGESWNLWAANISDNRAL